VNNHQSANTHIQNGKTSNCSLILDKLSICFNDPNAENVEATYGLLVCDHITKFTPGMTVTKNQRYMASCRLRLPLDGTVQETVCFEAGPTRPGQASYRLEFNPAKLTKAGLDDLIVFLNSIIDPDPVEFFRGGKVTRCDVAIDLPGYRLEDVIVRTSRLQKHGVYADRYGTVQTTYVGTPKSRCVVAYDKPLEGSLLTRLRLECRLKPRCLLAQLKDPFAGVQLLPAHFSESSGIAIPARLIADSIRIGGLKRALEPLDASQRKALKKAYQQAKSLLPNLDDQWAAWPVTLTGYGLGKELGAVPLVALGTGLAVNCKPSTGGMAANVPPTAPIKHSDASLQSCP
jgi:hypothetical protein